MGCGGRDDVVHDSGSQGEAIRERFGHARRAALSRTEKSCGSGAPGSASRSGRIARSPTGLRGASLRSDGVNTTKGPRGDHEGSRNTIAWGMPADSGASALNTGVHAHHLYMRTPGCGCIGHPAFPAPPLLPRDTATASTRGCSWPASAMPCLVVSDRLELAP